MTVLLSRDIGGIPLDVIISEKHKAEMEIAEHPVERGAKISDHAWRKPYSVEMDAVSLDIGAYEDLAALQASAEPFDLVTGLKVYENMLVKEMSATRDKEKARVTYVTVTCQEVIIVSTESGSAALGGKAGDKTAQGSSSKLDAAQGVTNRGQVQAREVTSVPGFNPAERLFAPPGSIVPGT